MNFGLVILAYTIANTAHGVDPDVAEPSFLVYWFATFFAFVLDFAKGATPVSRRIKRVVK